jgi:hypothetical protein
MHHGQQFKIQLPKINTFHFLCKPGDAHTYLSLAQTSLPPEPQIFNALSSSLQHSRTAEQQIVPGVFHAAAPSKAWYF